MQSDACAGFHHLYYTGRIKEAARCAHARRKFQKVHVTHWFLTTTAGVERIAALCFKEGEIGDSVPELCRKIWQTRAALLLASMNTWLEDMLAKLSRRSDMAAAIATCLARPHLRMKNSLFAGFDVGGEQVAAMYSLPGSAKLNDVDPEIYLHHVLECIADYPISRIKELLLWNVSLHITYSWLSVHLGNGASNCRVPSVASLPVPTAQTNAYGKTHSSYKAATRKGRAAHSRF